jgi:dsDNA-binding SOS-regulon protein
MITRIVASDEVVLSKDVVQKEKNVVALAVSFANDKKWWGKILQLQKKDDPIRASEPKSG